MKDLPVWKPISCWEYSHSIQKFGLTSDSLTVFLRSWILKDWPSGCFTLSNPVWIWIQLWHWSTETERWRAIERWWSCWYLVRNIMQDLEFKAHVQSFRPRLTPITIRILKHPHPATSLAFISTSYPPIQLFYLLDIWMSPTLSRRFDLHLFITQMGSMSDREVVKIWTSPRAAVVSVRRGL